MVHLIERLARRIGGNVDTQTMPSARVATCDLRSWLPMYSNAGLSQGELPVFMRNGGPPVPVGAVRGTRSDFGATLVQGERPITLGALRTGLIARGNVPLFAETEGEMHAVARDMPKVEGDKVVVSLV